MKKAGGLLAAVLAMALLIIQLPANSTVAQASALHTLETGGSQSLSTGDSLQSAQARSGYVDSGEIDMDDLIAASKSISGTVTSFGDAAGEVTVKLMQGKTEISKVVTTDGSYRFYAVASGDYQIVVSKLNHATRTYDVTMESTSITHNMKIHLLGDITGDGLLNIKDVNQANAHAKRRATLTGYDFACADINGDDAINIMDVNCMNAHAKQRKLLW